MLAEADTIQKAKELKDLALTAKDWAKRKGLGEVAIATARRYALEAERRMGQMLGETERATGAADGSPGPGRGKNAVTDGDHVLIEQPPTLSALGITKNESSKAQRLVTLPEDKFEKIREGKLSRAKAYKDVMAEQKRRELALIHSLDKLRRLGKNVCGPLHSRRRHSNIPSHCGAGAA